MSEILARHEPDGLEERHGAQLPANRNRSRSDPPTPASPNSPVAEHHRPVDEAVDDLEIVGCDEDDTAPCFQLEQTLRQVPKSTHRRGPVNGSSSNSKRGSCSSARSSVRRWRMPREKL